MIITPSPSGSFIHGGDVLIDLFCQVMIAYPMGVPDTYGKYHMQAGYLPFARNMAAVVGYRGCDYAHHPLTYRLLFFIYC
jgi:hypothetical protein